MHFLGVHGLGLPVCLAVVVVAARPLEPRSLPTDPAKLQESLEREASGPGDEALWLIGMKATVHGPSTLYHQRQESSNRGFFVWLSDVHVDPNYSNTSAKCARKHGAIPGGRALPFATTGCDPPESLWASAVHAAARFGQDADFVLTTGDFVVHHPYKVVAPSLDVSSVISSTARILKDGFPWLGAESIIMGSQGNNDSPLDYELNVTTNDSSNPWLAECASDWQRVGVLSSRLAQTYSYGGYFETEVGGLRILSLNTIIYSVLHQPMEPLEPDPFGQFAWLRSRLLQAVREKRRVWIVGHVPPGTETFSYTALWREEYVREYLSLVEDPVLGNAIAAQLFGHVHADEFRVLRNAPAEAGPVLLTGALSPIYNSNPSFRLVEYDKTTGKLLNVKVFWAPVPKGDSGLQWRFGYDLTGTYPELRKSVEHSGGLTNDHFAQFQDSLWRSWNAGGKEFGTYATWYKTCSGNDLGCCTLYGKGPAALLSLATKHRYVAKYFCALNVSGEAGFGLCAERFSLTPLIKPIRTYKYHEWEDFEEARQSHWRSIVGMREKAPAGELCLHMISQAME